MATAQTLKADSHAVECPFPGLRAYEVEDNPYFYGRERHLRELLRRFDKQHFLAVIGPSGAGKSSLVRAGLLPELLGGNLARTSSHWRTCTCMPGSDPFGALAHAVATLSLPDTAPNFPAHADQVRIKLERSSVGLLQAVGEIGLTDDENVLVVVDQFEELFTHRDRQVGTNAWSDKTASFIDLLLEVVRPGAGHPGAVAARMQHRFFVVITMRTDYLEECGEFRELYDALNRGQFLVPRLSDEQQEEAIRGPLEEVGVTAEDALVVQVLNDIRGAQDELPILQHALRRTWTQWKRDPDPSAPSELKRRHYLAAGGLARAIDKHAEEIFDGLTEEQQYLTQILFRRTTQTDSADKRSRHPTTLKEIAAVAGVEESPLVEVVNAFRQSEARFLRPALPVKLTGDSKIDVSHEAVFRSWLRATTWMKEEHADARWLRDLNSRVTDHERSGDLLTSVKLEGAKEWRAKRIVTQLWASRYGVELAPIDGLLAASKEAVDLAAKQRRRLLTLWGVLALVFVAFVTSLGFMGALVVETKRANANANELEEAHGNLAAVQRRLTDAKVETEDAEAKLMEAQAKVKAATAKMTEAEAKVTEVEAKVTKAEAKVTKAEAKVMEAEAKVMEAEAKVTKARNQVQDVNRELNRRRQELDDTKQQLGISKAELMSALERSRRILESAAIANESVPKLQTDLRAATFERDQLRDRVKAAEAQSQQASRDLASCRTAAAAGVVPP